MATDELYAQALRELAAAPTGPWIDGDQPEEEGDYLCQLRGGQYTVARTSHVKDGAFRRNPVVRHAKINDSQTTGGRE